MSQTVDINLLHEELSDAEQRLARAFGFPLDERADALQEIRRQKRQIQREIERYLKQSYDFARTTLKLAGE